jgi:pimeloyl-ACP methyl ester carboxylesterase
MLWLLLAIAVAAAIGLSLNAMALRIVRPPKRAMPRTAADLPFAFDDVSFESDGRTLRGWIIYPNVRSGHGVAVVAHGWASNSGEVLPIAEGVAASGHTAFVFDFRRHGRSDEAPHVTISDYRDDLIAAIGFVRERFPEKQMVVVGHSMGGAASILAAADGAPVDGIAIVASPADLVEMTVEYLNEGWWPGAVLGPLIVPILWMKAGGNRDELVPERRMADVTVPSIVIHPEYDKRVPRRHARRLADLAGCELRIVPDSGHVDILKHPGMHEAVVEFLGKCTEFESPTAQAPPESEASPPQ